MRQVRFVITKNHRKDTLNWKRFLAGSIMAITFVLIGTTVASAFQLRNRPLSIIPTTPESSATQQRVPSQKPITATSSLSGAFFTSDTTPTHQPSTQHNNITIQTTTLPTTPAASPPSVFEATVTLPSAISQPSQPAQNQTPTVIIATPSPTAPATATTIATTMPPNVAQSPTAPTQTATSTPAPTNTATPAPSIEPSPTSASNQPSSPTDIPPVGHITIPTDTPAPETTQTHTPESPNTDGIANTPVPTNTPEPTNTNTPESDDSSDTNTSAVAATPIPTAIPTPSDITIFGTEINQNYVESTMPLAQEVGFSWVRYNGILWHEIEATEGNPDWSKLAKVDAELQAMQTAGVTPIVIIRGAPEWARQVPTSACGPIKADKLNSFASFVQQIVQRYSELPYNVKYWEIGNEPDVDVALVAGSSPFGCWGNNNDDYYGGGYYADMLKTVYPIIKQTDPAATVVAGGLLLDCDPTNPPEGKDCKPARFLEGILRNGGGNAFDILSYHGYSYWKNEQTDWDLHHPSWKHRGGAIAGRADFLRSVLQQYNLTKPILVNEIGLLCYQYNDTASATCMQNGFLEAQQNYAIRAYTRAWAEGLLGAAWYTFNYNGWQEAGILDRTKTPRPVYHTIKFMTELLQGATFDSDATAQLQATLQNGQKVHVFRKDTITYHIYWTNDGSTFELTIPENTVEIFSQSGTPKDWMNKTSITVGFEPVLLDIQP